MVPTQQVRLLLEIVDCCTSWYCSFVAPTCRAIERLCAARTVPSQAAIQKTRQQTARPVCSYIVCSTTMYYFIPPITIPLLTINCGSNSFHGSIFSIIYWLLFDPRSLSHCLCRSCCLQLSNCHQQPCCFLLCVIYMRRPSLAMMCIFYHV